MTADKLHGHAGGFGCPTSSAGAVGYNQNLTIVRDNDKAAILVFRITGFGFADSPRHSLALISGLRARINSIHRLAICGSAVCDRAKLLRTSSISSTLSNGYQSA